MVLPARPEPRMTMRPRMRPSTLMAGRPQRAPRPQRPVPPRRPTTELRQKTATGRRPKSTPLRQRQRLTMRPRPDPTLLRVPPLAARDVLRSRVRTKSLTVTHPHRPTRTALSTHPLRRKGRACARPASPGAAARPPCLPSPSIRPVQRLRDQRPACDDPHHAEPERTQPPGLLAPLAPRAERLRLASLRHTSPPAVQTPHTRPRPGGNSTGVGTGLLSTGNS